MFGNNNHLLQTIAFRFSAISICSLSLIILLSLFVTLTSLFSGFNENWQHFREYLLGNIFRNTLLLVFFNVLFSLSIGILLAWLVTRFEFYGRRIFEKLLYLPIAIPPYIFALIMLDIFDGSGQINYQLEQFGLKSIQLDFSQPIWISLTMSASLIPYVYIIFRSSFLVLQNSLLEYGQVLGMGSIKQFFKIVLPISRPALIASSSIIVMETLADFGTVSIFNFDTLTALIYKSWFDLFDLTTAMQLASLLFFIIAIFYFLEKLLSINKKFNNTNQHIGIERIGISTKANLTISIFCLCFILLTFILPLIVLIYMNLQISNDQLININELIDIIFNTLLITFLSMIIIVSIGFLMVVINQESFKNSNNNKILQPLFKFLIFFPIWGYAIPGVVIAISIINFILYTSDLFSMEKIATQSFIVLLFAYFIRFVALIFNNLTSSISRLNNYLFDVATTMGFNQLKIIKKVYWPLLKKPTIAGGILVTIEIIKELPLTLLLNPFGWQTLATDLYSYAQEGEWTRASLSATIIVLLSTFIIITMNRNINTHD